MLCSRIGFTYKKYVDQFKVKSISPDRVMVEVAHGVGKVQEIRK